MSHSRSSDIEESEDSEGTQYSEEKWHARRLTGIVFCITFTACFAAICIIAITSHGSGDIHAICVRNELLLTKLNNSIPTDEVQVAMIGHLLGEQRLKKLMATMLALVSFLAIIIATCTSTIEINLDREKMPPDFEMKGTFPMWPRTLPSQMGGCSQRACSPMGCCSSTRATPYIFTVLGRPGYRTNMSNLNFKIQWNSFGAVCGWSSRMFASCSPHHFQACLIPLG